MIVVTDQGPIDRHPPGTDVTGLYEPEVEERLISEGYLEESKPKRRRSRKKAAEVEADGDQ